MKLPWGIVALAVLIGTGAALLTGIALYLVAGGPAPLVLTGLNSPRGLTATDDGCLLLAEVMGGRLLRIDPEGRVSAETEGIPATFGGPGGTYPTGISSAVRAGKAYYYVVGEFRGRGFSTLYRLEKGGVPQPLAGGVGNDGFPADRITNPYDLALAPQGGIFISDSGLNAVLHVSESGKVSDYARFPDQEVTGTTASAQVSVEVVPTGLAIGPEGILYVASLTGFPYPPGGASIYRLEDRNGDGDAQDEGERTIFARGFSAATDLAFQEDGSLLVAEFSTDMLTLVTQLGLEQAADLPGRVARWRDGEVEVVAEGLVSPTSVVVSGGRIFVSEEFAGRVREIVTPATPARGRTAWPWSGLAGLGTAVMVVLGWLLRRKARNLG